MVIILKYFIHSRLLHLKKIILCQFSIVLKAIIVLVYYKHYKV